ncbi:MAG: serine/threonine-protein kinase [Acidobacteria bacterium]|nr:serine/threonine-protein kinase [Acidobacteriota bacterium]
MALSSGSHLGPYEILSPLGAGGMGEVYKARDTRLNRIVAIKTSIEEFSDRFDREARAVAALNHPNICTLYDVGPSYLVMEYLEGQPIHGPQPVEKALEWSIQICDALDAAHRKGVTHRDLKPANIRITKSGIKLLDFSLAKTNSAESPILGTLHYMSPEQVEGKEAGPRSDIFAFGAVLYELITGNRPFDGGSQAGVIAAILHNDAPAVSPPDLNRLLQRCLAKNPDDRWQTARDLKAELEWIAAPSVSETAKPRKRFGLVGWITAAILLATASPIVPWRIFKSIRPFAQSAHFAIYPPDGTTFARANNATVPTPQFALSPDGRYLVFSASVTKPALWLRSMEDTTARAIPGTENALGPFWSPDSKWLGFFAGGKIMRLPIAGGPVQVILEGVIDHRGATWCDEDTILYGSGADSVYRVSITGRTKSALALVDPAISEIPHRWPQCLPDNRHFFFTVRGGDAGQRGIFVASLDGKNIKRLILSDSSAIYAPPGYILWNDRGTLMAQAFRLDRLELEGSPVAIAPGVGRSSTGEAAISVSQTGILTHSTNLTLLGRLQWYDRAGKPLDSPVPESDYIDFRLSPDFTRIAATRLDSETGNADIWITDLARKSTSRLTSAPTLDASPAWSPDGTRIVFRSNPYGRMELFQTSASGGGVSAVVLSIKAQLEAGMSALSVVNGDWSGDGKYVIYSSSLTDSKFGLAVFPIGENGPPRRFGGPATAFVRGHPNFSPDSLCVAYESNETGKTEIYVEPFQPGERRWKVSANGGSEPRWRSDGKEIYYLSEEKKLMAVPVGPGPAFGFPVELFQTRVPVTADVFRTNYVPDREGRRFLVNTQSPKQAPVAITLLLHWTAALKK